MKNRYTVQTPTSTTLTDADVLGGGFGNSDAPGQEDGLK